MKLSIVLFIPEKKYSTYDVHQNKCYDFPKVPSERKQKLKLMRSTQDSLENNENVN